MDEGSRHSIGDRDQDHLKEREIQKDQSSAATSGVQRAKAKAESKDLIDRVPEELWTEVCDIVQEADIKTIPRVRKAKWLSEEALQIAVKRREVKGKGEKKTYTHLNAEFQRIARRDNKAFLSDQCKETEGKK